MYNEGQKIEEHGKILLNKINALFQLLTEAALVRVRGVWPNPSIFDHLEQEFN